jgi:hypothetical protein
MEDSNPRKYIRLTAALCGMITDSTLIPGQPAPSRTFSWPRARGGGRDHGITFRVPVKRLILVKGPGHQTSWKEVSHRIMELDPDVMTGGQYDAELAGLRAGRDRLKALPAEPDRWDEQLTGSCTPASARLSPLGNAERG